MIFAIWRRNDSSIIARVWNTEYINSKKVKQVDQIIPAFDI